jgi:hypothetical protein
MQNSIESSSPTESYDIVKYHIQVYVVNPTVPCLLVYSSP